MFRNLLVTAIRHDNLLHILGRGICDWNGNQMQSLLFLAFFVGHDKFLFHETTTVIPDGQIWLWLDTKIQCHCGSKPLDSVADNFQ